MLSSVISSAMTPIPSEGGYQVENVPVPVVSQPTSQVTVPPTTQPPVLPSAININDLFQKLVATGIVTTGITETTTLPKPTQPKLTQPPVPKAVPIKKDFTNIRPVTFDKIETLRR